MDLLLMARFPDHLVLLDNRVTFRNARLGGGTQRIQRVQVALFHPVKSSRNSEAGLTPVTNR